MVCYNTVILNAGRELDMDCKRSYILLDAGMLGGTVVVFLGLGVSTKIEIVGSMIALAGLLIMLGGLGQAFLFYKCTNCGRKFSIRSRKPDRFPVCGRKLEM